LRLLPAEIKPMRRARRCAILPGKLVGAAMAIVTFTSNLRRHRDVPKANADGATVRDVLDRVFADDPLLRGYVLDDQGRLRRHVNVFLNGAPVADRARLSDPAGPADEIHVLQALSGG
jgi:sulfur-carrier protein